MRNILFILISLFLFVPFCFAEEAPRTKSELCDKYLDKHPKTVVPILMELSQKLQKTWHPLYVPHGTSAVVRFKLKRDGNIQDLTLIDSSGNSAFNKSFLQAIQNVQKLEKFPHRSTCEELLIDFNYGPKSSSTRPILVRP